MSLRLLFVVDRGTDVRLVDELAMRTELRVLARTIPGGRVVSQQTRHEPQVEIGPSGHAAFASFAARRILTLRRQTDVVVVQGYGPTAAVVNLAARLAGVRASMLVCSPVEAYYRCRSLPHSTRRFSASPKAMIVRAPP